MAIIPDQRPPGAPISSPAVDHAERDLRDMYVDNAAIAAVVLPMWRHYDALSDQERAAVIARFTPEPVQHRFRSRFTPGGNLLAWCVCGAWKGVAPSERAAARGWARHKDDAGRAVR